MVMSYIGAHKCRVCGVEFWRTWRTYRCDSCRRQYEKEWRVRRKAQGRPVVTANMPSKWHREYEAEYYQNPVNRARRAAASFERRKDPKERSKDKARRLVRTAVKNGRLKRLPCEICGSEPADGHHDDYSKPLDVRWLCRPHHGQIHAKAQPATDADDMGKS